MSLAVGSDRPPIAGRYELKQLLGRGGMGAVFLARDLKYDRLVAVKFLTRRSPGSVGVERFQAEIRTAARLNHPNILSLHDSGEADGRLFYVMPYVQGASLAARIRHQRRIPVDEALRIARQVACALAHAHAQGIIHRDIKPDNILLDPAGHVYVADFGLARALSAARNTRLTGTGHVVGSPLYMSPEQALDDGDLDARSDIYSLGCVLFEMLAGVPPFTGTSAPETLRRHLHEPAPSPRAMRADVPESLARSLARMLEKSPERRYPTADAVVADLDIEIARGSARADAPRSDRARRPWRRNALLAAAAVLVLAVGALFVSGGPRAVASSLFAAPLDSNVLAVLPLSWDGPVEDPERENAMLHAGLTRWSDLRLASWTTFADVAGAGEALSERDARRAARRTGAARFIQGRATPFGDSIQLDLALLDARQESALERRVNMRIRRGDQSAIALLVDSLLFGRVTWDGDARTDVGTASSEARRAYGAGHAALATWDLVRTDSLMAAAVEIDPAFGRAHLWLGQARLWAGEPIDRWRAQALRARQNSAELTPRERLLAEGLAALAEARHADACAAYHALVMRDPRDFAALVGGGECLRRDRMVVRDARSPSGWAFRSSVHGAVSSFADAFRALPARYAGLRGPAASRLGAVLFTHRNMVWSGTDADGRGYVAFPEWRGDTLAMVPWPDDADIRLDDEAWDRALTRHRLLYHEIARSWSSAFPREPEALYAVGTALEMLADGGALEMIHRARAESGDPTQALRFGVHEVWLLVKRGLPQGSEDLERARVLADSLLRIATAVDPADTRLLRRLKGLALLTGRPDVAARLARDSRTSAALGVTERASELLLLYAAAGGPPERLTDHERAVERSIRAAVGVEDRLAARVGAMEQAAVLAYPTHPLAATSAGLPFGSPVARAQAAHAAGDARRAARLLRDVHAARATAYDRVSVDIVYAEAALLVALGDTAAAVAQLDDALGSLSDNQPGTLEDPARAGALVRAMALRAELAAAAGDVASARRWGAAAAALWSRGEPVVRPFIDRMLRITNR